MTTFEKIGSTFIFLFFIGFIVVFFLYFRLNSGLKNFQINKDNSANFDFDTEIDSANGQTIKPTRSIDLVAQVEDLQASSQALLSRIEELEASNPTTATKYVTTTKTIFQNQIIHIGSASTRSNDWTNSGVEVTLNSADYPNSVDAAFEVGISIISGNGWARLINKTTGAVMSVTEVFADSSTTTWKTSPKFKLHSGTNTYELQIRSDSSEEANFSSARIILTN